MTLKEKEKLAELVSCIIEITEILHSPLADNFLSVLEETEDNSILDVLISHLNSMRVYELYNRFDKKASADEISKLYNLISKMKKED